MTPAECRSLEEVRSAIDSIDEQVIALLGRRAGFVQAAARFKTSEADVAAPERFAAMLKVRREWAEREGLSPDVIEKMYRDLVAYFIVREKEHWQAQSPPTPLP
jgi:isochorismate pyruvate lyase